MGPKKSLGREMMARTTSIITQQKLVEIERRTFFCGRKVLSVYRTVFKIVVTTDTQMAEKNFKI